MTAQRIATTRSRSSSFEWLSTCLSDQISHHGAYPVPWRDLASFEAREEHEDARCFVNVSTEVLRQVRVWRACQCGVRSSLPSRVVPGDQLGVSRDRCGKTGCGEGAWFLRWFMEDETELVWPFVW